MTSPVSRRVLLTSSVIAAASHLAPKASAAETSTDAHHRPIDVNPKHIDHVYEVSFTEAEWRERLSEEEFRILRKNGTEKEKSNPLWKEKRPGFYKCKGCDLGLYDSEHKIILKKGWAFFRHSEPDSVLTGIDLFTDYGSSKKETAIEAHCRRCGSHLGHILYVKKKILHCINGTSLSFTPLA